MSGIPAGAGSLLGKRLGNYEILALLALGGTAEIYLARIGGTNGFEKYVVVKCLHDHLADDPEFTRMFLDEARLAAVLDHSNIVQTLELGEHEDRYYMVMEFLAGLSLAMIVRRAAERLPGGRLPVPLVLNIAAQACAGLHYAHDKQASGKPLNMVHRDISPQNLVVSFEGVVKVVDFGIARADQRDTKTKAGTIKGKFAYMSPEQCVASNIDRRTDVFALGVIVWELLTGRRLFKRNSPYETYQAVIECNVPLPSSLNVELDPQIDAIVMKAVAKAKESRYPTAEAFGDALAKYLHQRGKGSSPGELGRYLEEGFAQEIEEHGERMRELIANRDHSSVDGMGWGDEEEDKRASETVDLGSKAMTLGTADLMPVRPSDASLQSMVSRLQTDMDGGADAHADAAGDAPGDDEAPPDKTRIEENPLERVRAMEEAGRAAGAKTPVPVGTSTGGPAPLPAPPAAGAAPGAAPGPAGRKKFPDASNLPTMIHDEKPPPEAYRTPGVGTARPAELTRPPPTGAEMAATAMAQPIDPNKTVMDFGGSSGALGEPQPPRIAQQTGPSYLAPAAPPHRPTAIAQDAVDPAMLEPPPPQQQHMQYPPGPQIASPYPVMAGGRPYSSDLAPSDLRPPQRSPYNAASAPSQPPPSASYAANVMSPVGEHYPQQDWAAVAARPAKALPPWALAVLFVIALGAALVVTIVIAKIIR
jgi:eukaryotic-like serine/threonine-protein kinase